MIVVCVRNCQNCQIGIIVQSLSLVVVESEMIAGIGQTSRDLKDRTVPVLSLHHGLESAMPRGDSQR
jgi:hypothetical protein